MDNLSTIVGRNIASLRKAKGLTQQELAAEVNYSDKSISKWELGYAVPSVDILMDFAAFFGVSIDYLVTEQSQESIDETALAAKKKKEAQADSRNKAIIMAMTVSFALLVAMSIYFSSYFVHYERNDQLWTAFLWAIPVTLFVCAMETHYFYHNSVGVTVLLSLFTWALFICFCIQFQFVNSPGENIWFILVAAIPVQVIIVLAQSYIRKGKRR